MASSDPPPHGLYTEDGHRIKEWKGRIVVNPNTGAPQLDPPVRLKPGEQVFAWWQGELVAAFGDGGQQVKHPTTMIEL